MTNPNDSVYPSEQQAIAIKAEIADKFPELIGEIQTIAHRIAGLTKREYFAAMAMQGMLVGSAVAGVFFDKKEDIPIKDKIMQASVLSSDCLIAELNKESK